MSSSSSSAAGSYRAVGDKVESRGYSLRWFFGLEKSERANVSANELEALQALASELLALSGAQLELAVNDGALQEICHDC